MRDEQRLAGVWTASTASHLPYRSAQLAIPLMEVNVVEAITNNVIGLRNVVQPRSITMWNDLS